MSAYDDVEREARNTRTVRDHTRRWDTLTPVADASSGVLALIDEFCASKGITRDALAALGTRTAARRGGSIWLAYAGRSGTNVVTAIKYRPLSGSSHESESEKPSVWLRPIVVGKLDSLDWFVAEGETEGARLFDLVGSDAAIMVLPAGAKTFRREWADLIPRGATVYLALDADADGDKGAAKAARLIGGRTVRVRPPDGAKDWCEWPGDRAAFVQLVHDAKPGPSEQMPFVWTPLSSIEEKPIVYVWEPWLQASAFHLLCGIKNAGKGTLIAYLAAKVTRGEFGEKRHVLWIALGEDSYAIDVKPRVLAAGGDPACVTVLEDARLVLPADAQEIVREATALADARHPVGLIVLDPVSGTLAGGKSSNFDVDVRPAMQSLNSVADKTGAIVLGVRHLSNKPERRQEGLLAALLGSSEWANVPRAVLGLLHDDVDKQTRHLFLATGNRSKEGTPGLMVRIEGHLLPGHEHEVTKLDVLGASSKDPDELLAKKRPRQMTRTDAARRLILATLRAAPDMQMESDELDAAVATRTGLVAKTIRNLRNKMRDEGLLRPMPDKDETGTVKRWLVTLTLVGAAEADPPEGQITPTHDLKGSGLTEPDPVLRVSGSGQVRDLDGDDLDADFVTPPEQLALQEDAPTDAEIEEATRRLTHRDGWPRHPSSMVDAEVLRMRAERMRDLRMRDRLMRAERTRDEEGT